QPSTSTSAHLVPTLSTLGEQPPAAARSHHPRRAFPPHPPNPNTDAFFANQTQSSSTNSSFYPHPSLPHAQPSSMTPDAESHAADHMASTTSTGTAGFEFVPTMTFDDFQNSLTDPNWTSPLLSEFPTHQGGRALPKEEG
ncbi:hypothetical protein LTR53_019211, partial [Teratosphaeriaceae sp. CCFEE 6253]